MKRFSGGFLISISSLKFKEIAFKQCPPLLGIPMILTHLVLVYRAETCRDTSKWGYLRCVKNLSKKSLIQIFNDVIANPE